MILKIFADTCIARSRHRNKKRRLHLHDTKNVQHKIKKMKPSKLMITVKKPEKTIQDIINYRIGKRVQFGRVKDVFILDGGNKEKVIVLKKKQYANFQKFARGANYRAILYQEDSEMIIRQCKTVNYDGYFIDKYYQRGDLMTIILNGTLYKNMAPFYANFLQVLLMCKYINDRGFVHRDIKPENILVGDNFDFKLIDFDDMTKCSECHSNGVFRFGTHIYQKECSSLQEEELEDRVRRLTNVDRYSMGCTLYGIITGEPASKEGYVSRKDEEHMLKNLLNNYPFECMRLVQSCIADDSNWDVIIENYKSNIFNWELDDFHLVSMQHDLVEEQFKEKMNSVCLDI